MKKSFEYIDIAKFLFSICIIALHTLVLDSFNSDINWYITHCVFRLAVPFFFVTSGFFYGRKILNNGNNIDKVTNNYIRKLFYPFIFWLLVGIIPEFINTFKGNFFITFILLVRKVFFYPWGALWYILSLMVAVFILSKFYKRGKFILPIIIGSCLYIFALISNSYYFVIDDINIFKIIVDLYNEIFISSRNGIFVGLLFVSVGVFLAKVYQEKQLFSFHKNILFFLICYFVLIFEVTFIRNRAYIEDNSLFVVMPVLIFFLVSILLQTSNNKSYTKLRSYSILFYLIHRPVIGYLGLFFNIKSNILLFIIVITIVFIISYLLSKSKNRIVKILTLT